MLTEKAVLAATPRDRDYKVADAGGLHLLVTKAGARSWRYKYRFGGKEKLLVIGRHPAVSLKSARLARDEAKKTLAQGRDPALEARRVKLVGAGREEETFEQVARRWHEAQKARWKPVHADDVIESLERDLFPVIGAYPITQIDEPLLLAALRKVEDRGAIETARRLRQRAERIFKLARAGGAGNANPAVDVKEAMKPLPKKKRRPAITELPKLRKLTAEVDQAAASPVTRLASRFLALTAQRPGMVQRLPWAEIEGVDWDRPDQPSPGAVWHVPSEFMKLEFERRDDDEWDHYVPLQPQAVEVLHIVRRLTGRGPMVFPSNRSAHDPMSANAVGYLYNRIGYKGRPRSAWLAERLLHDHERAGRACAARRRPAPDRSSDHRPDAGPCSRRHERDRVPLQSEPLHGAQAGDRVRLGRSSHRRGRFRGDAAGRPQEKPAQVDRHAARRA